MRGTKLVIPLVILGAGLFVTPASSVGHSAPHQPPKTAKVEQRVSKKESRMNKRDREMDKRMKQKKMPKVVRKVGPIAVLRRVQRVWKRIAIRLITTMADWVSPFRFVQM